MKFKLSINLIFKSLWMVNDIILDAAKITSGWILASVTRKFKMKLSNPLELCAIAIKSLWAGEINHVQKSVTVLLPLNILSLFPHDKIEQSQINPSKTLFLVQEGQVSPQFKHVECFVNCSFLQLSHTDWQTTRFG